MQAIFVQEHSRGLVWRCNCTEAELAGQMAEAVAAMTDADQCVLAVPLSAFAQPEAEVPLQLWLPVTAEVERKPTTPDPQLRSRDAGLFGGR